MSVLPGAPPTISTSPPRLPPLCTRVSSGSRRAPTSRRPTATAAARPTGSTRCESRRKTATACPRWTCTAGTSGTVCHSAPTSRRAPSYGSAHGAHTRTDRARTDRARPCRDYASSNRIFTTHRTTPASDPLHPTPSRNHNASTFTTATPFYASFAPCSYVRHTALSQPITTPESEILARPPQHHHNPRQREPLSPRAATCATRRSASSSREGPTRTRRCSCPPPPPPSTPRSAPPPP